MLSGVRPFQLEVTHSPDGRRRRQRREAEGSGRVVRRDGGGSGVVRRAGTGRVVPGRVVPGRVVPFRAVPVPLCHALCPQDCGNATCAEVRCRADGVARGQRVLVAVRALLRMDALRQVLQHAAPRGHHRVPIASPRCPHGVPVVSS